MRRLSRALLGATALLGLAVSAMAATIDTTGQDTGTIYSFGSPNTATYGQTFSPVAGQTQMTGFSLFCATAGTARARSTCAATSPAGTAARPPRSSSRAPPRP